MRIATSAGKRENDCRKTITSNRLQKPHRPNAVQAPGGLEVEQQIIQAALPRPADPGSSGTLCLNLNLSVPKGATANSVLPVLVFIHGGGFFTGANWWPQYDTRRLVRLSVARGQPLIVANIK